MCHGTEVRAGIQTPVSPAHSFENLQAFSVPSVLSLPITAKSVFYSCSFSLSCLWGWRSTGQQHPGDLMKTAASSSHSTPDNHYISGREESITAAEINKPACFFFQSEERWGLFSRAKQPSLARRAGKNVVILVLVWTKYLETGWA